MNAKAQKTTAKKHIGISCPDCKYPARVMHTYHYKNGAMIHRRRQCPNGHRFSTVEKILAG